MDLSLAYNLNDVVLEVDFPQKDIIEYDDVFWPSDAQSIYRTFNECLQELLGTAAVPLKSVTLPPISVFGLLKRKYLREANENIRVEQLRQFEATEKLKRIKMSSLYGQACWNAYINTNSQSDCTAGIPDGEIDPFLATVLKYKHFNGINGTSTPVIPAMIEVDFFLEAILKQAEKNGKIISPEVYNYFNK